MRGTSLRSWYSSIQAKYANSEQAYNRIYEYQYTCYNGITYGFCMQNSNSIMNKFIITREQLQERYESCNSLSELFSGLELCPGSCCGFKYDCWQDICDLLSVDMDYLYSEFAKGERLYNLIYHKYGTKFWNVSDSKFTAYSMDYYKNMAPEDIAEFITHKIDLTFGYDSKDKTYPDYVTAIVTLVRVSELTREELVSVISSCRSYLQKFVRDKIYADKRFANCINMDRYLVCSNCTLTSQGELVYKFGWAGDRK